MHPATLSIELLLRDCQLKAVRRSGPGGQHRNKVSTGIVITHLPTRTIAEATEGRSQAMNREQAVFRLRVRMALEVRANAHQETDEALQALGKAYGGVRLRIGSDNSAYPSLLALVLDRIHGDRGELVSISRLLATSTSQIVRLLREQPLSLKLVNQWRRDAGLGRLA